MIRSSKAIIVFFILIFSVSLYSQVADTSSQKKKKTTQKDNKFQIALFYNQSSGSSFYNIDGEAVPSQEISRGEFEEPQEFTFEYTEYTIGFDIHYKLNEKVTFYSVIPYTLYRLEEKYKWDTTLESQELVALKHIDGYSLNQFKYFAIGSKYRIYSKKAFSDISLELRVPPGFDDSVINKDSTVFLSDGAMQVLSGIHLGVELEGIKLETSFRYNFRGEELSDLLLVHTEGWLSNIPEIKLFFFGDYVKSLDPFKNSLSFHPKRTTTHEDYLGLGVGFHFDLSKNMFFNFKYNVTIWGKNTLNINSPTLKFGIKI